MLEAIRKVRAALAAKDVVPQFAHLLVKDGFVLASNGLAVAAAPWPGPAGQEFLVRGAEFENVMARMSGDVKITVDDGDLKMTSGRFRGAVRSLDPSIAVYPKPDGKMCKCPDDFVVALRTLRGLMDTTDARAFIGSMRLDGSTATTASGHTFAKMPCTAPLSGLLPADAIDYIIKRKEKLTHVAQGEGSMAFRWDDKSWYSTRLIDAEFPGVIDKLLEDGTPSTWVITDEWRAAFERVAGLSETAIKIYADRITGGGMFSDVEDAAVSPVPDGEESTAWNPKYLGAVLEVAETIDFTTWPNPITWSGNGAHGVTMGRRA